MMSTALVGSCAIKEIRWGLSLYFHWSWNESRKADWTQKRLQVQVCSWGSTMNQAASPEFRRALFTNLDFTRAEKQIDVTGLCVLNFRKPNICNPVYIRSRLGEKFQYLRSYRFWSLEIPALNRDFSVFLFAAFDSTVKEVYLVMS